MIYQLYKLEFLNHVRFGKRSLNDVEYTLHADTLYSALYIEALKVGKQEEFYDITKNGDVTFSDAFLYRGNELYIPKPYIKIKNQENQGNSSEKKKYKKIPYIAYLRMKNLVRNIAYQSTSEEESAAIIKYLKADSEKIHFLTNIPSIPEKQYIHELKKSGEGKFVFVSRIHPKKNLISAIEYMKDIKGKVVFDIYGPIEDEEYWKQCNQKIHELPQNITVNYCGLVNHEKVHEIFSLYNAFLFPTFCENYGHVIAEALSVGTAVIISDQTPWSDINEAKAGWAIPLDNREKFVEAIQSVIDQKPDDNQKQIKAVEKYINNKVNLKEIRQEYKKAFDL